MDSAGADPGVTSRRWGAAAVAGGVTAWIAVALLLDSVRAWDGAEAVRQVVLGLVTWALLAVLLRREPTLVRVQTLVVVALATLVEYTFSPLLGAYVYRIGTVPLFVPPGHGLVYLAALALGRSDLLRRAPRAGVAGTIVVGGCWAVLGVAAPGRADALGAFWFGCLLLFLLRGPSRLLYVGAFVMVSYLELLGTRLGTWTWAPRDPLLGVIPQGNPPSGAAGGYGWFDLYALWLAPRIQGRVAAARADPGTRRAGRSGALTGGGRSSGGQGAQDGLVQLAVRGQGAAPERPVDAVE
ncbi:MAG TPA: hypothetical protein VI248_08205 [Kineosporiaceae bacterium]